MPCVDTTVLVDLGGRGGPELKTRADAYLLAARRNQEVLTTTRFCVAELYLGVERSRHKDIEEVRVQNVLKGLPVLDFDESAARMYASIMADLLRAGTPIGDMDVLIASVAMAHGQVLVTRNTAHFSKIPLLTIGSY